MKKNVFIITIVIIVVLVLMKMSANASNERDMKLQGCNKIEMTYYLATGNQCANGKFPRYGICAYSREYINQTAIVYDIDGSLIGYFEIYDTGYGRLSTIGNGKGTIENEECIDIFMESDADGKEFIKRYGNEVYVKIVDAKG